MRRLETSPTKRTGIMDERFKNKDLKVLAIDPSGSVRQTLSESLKDIGFKNCQGIANIDDAIELMEVEHVDWILTPFFKDDEGTNIIQLLKLITENKALSHTRVTLLVEAFEAEYLPAAYELGLLSHFSRPYTKVSIGEELQKFTKTLAENDYDMTLVASDYCIDMLDDMGKNEEQLEFLNSVLRSYPANPNVMLKMAKPYFNNGDKDKAKAVLQQVQLMSVEHAEHVSEIANKLFGTDKLGETEGEGSTNILGLEKCLIVDSDETSRKQTEQILNDIGVSSIESFEDGKEAAKWLKDNDEPSVILHEWKLPGLPGPYFIQRVRKQYPTMPLITISSLIKPEDSSLLSEFGVTAHIKKPFVKEMFIKQLIHAIQQDRIPTESNGIERKIRQLLKTGNTAKLKPMLVKYLQNDNIPQNRKLSIEAEYLFYTKDYEQAQTKTLLAIKHNGSSIHLLDLLGKILMKLGDYESALKCFEKAQNISPQNLDRICGIAEANHELGKEKEADAALDTAKKLDAENETVANTEAQIAIERGNTDRASQVMGRLDSLSHILGHMNNKAVALTLSDKQDDGIDLYIKTIASIPDNKKEPKSKVLYNLALAYAKVGDLQHALETLEQTKKLGKTKVTLKIKSLYVRIKKSIETKTPLALKAPTAPTSKPKEIAPTHAEEKKEEGEEESTETATIDHLLNFTTGLHVNPGEICCYKIFNNPSEPSADLITWLNTPVKFTHKTAS